MDISTAKRVTSVLSDFKKLAPSIKEVYPAGPLENFESWVNGMESEGGVLIENPAGDNIWLMFIDTKKTGEMNVVLYSEDKKKVIAVIKKSDSNNWLWSYAPRIRDGRNEERKAYFIKCLSSIEVIIPIPTSIEDVPKLFKQLLSIAEVRVKADDLSELSTQDGADLPVQSIEEPDKEKKYCKLGLNTKFGSHFLIGYIKDSDDELVDSITDKLECGEDIYCYPLFDDCGEDFLDNCDIAEAYGPHINFEADDFDILAFSDEKCTQRTEMPTVVGEFDDCTTFDYSMPMFNDHLDNDGARFIFAGEVLYKGFAVDIVIPLAENEAFDWSNLYFGAFNTEETFESDNVLTVAMYFNKEKKLELLKLMDPDETDPCIDDFDYVFNDFNEGMWSDTVGNWESKVGEEIRTNFLSIDNSDCGRSKVEQAIVISMDGDELYREQHPH